MEILSLSKLQDRIYLVSCNSRYDLTMAFLRYQEYYESPNPRFWRKPFTITEYMAWYSKDRDKPYFSYTEDWGGFNMPTKMIQEVWDKGISDPNHYDYLMRGILGMILDNGAEDAYLIGTPEKNKEQYLKHEIAHALFYTNKKYRDTMETMISKLPEKVYSEVKATLIRKGYTDIVIADEIQAYSSCNEDLAEFLDDEENTIAYADFIDGVIKIYNKYRNQAVVAQQ